ncbi:hypothetical protein D9M72_585410 [compost metagenome]
MHRDFFGLLLRHLANPDRRKRAVFQDRQVREQVEVLEHHADFAAHFVDLLEVVGQLDAVNDDLALLVLFEAIDAADHRRLAGARRAGNDDALAFHNLQVDVTKDVEVPVPLVHSSDFDCDIRCGNSHFGSSGCVCHAILPSFYRLWAVSRTRSMKPE